MFHYGPNRCEGERFITTNGIEVVNVRSPSHVALLNKRPGDYWVDFPLMTAKKPLGKATFDCDSDLSPQRFELLGVLAEMVSGLLETAFRSAQLEKESRWMQHAAHVAMANTTHNIASRIAMYPVFLRRYRRLEGECPRLRELNESLEKTLEETLVSIRRTKDMLTRFVPRPEMFDLVASVSRVLASALPDESWTVESSSEMVTTEGDKHVLETMLVELVQNSMEAAGSPSDLHVIVSLLIMQRDSEDWVKLVYRDNGPGVPIDLKERIFEDFFSLRRGSKAGAGLGLAFVRRVVSAHGGQVHEKGQLGQGAEFVIELPRYFAVHNRLEEGGHVSFARD